MYHSRGPPAGYPYPDSYYTLPPGPVPTQPPTQAPAVLPYTVLPPFAYPQDYYGQGPSVSPERHHRSKKSHKKRDERHRKSSSDESTLKEWSAWRAGINDKLSKDILRDTFHEIPVGKTYEKIKKQQKTGNTVYHYSTAIDQGTQLAKDDYINFGIPRVNLSGRRNDMTDSDTSSDDEEGTPFYSINKLKTDDRGDRQRYHGGLHVDPTAHAEVNGSAAASNWVFR